MSKKYIYTVGYTLFQQGNSINIEKMFETLTKYNISFLVDIRSVPFSKHYPQCNADIMKINGKKLGIPYMNMPEIGAKVDSNQNVFSKASDIFFEKEIFPIAKSSRPEKTELLDSDEIVDFKKFKDNLHFVHGLKRIEDAYNQGFSLCLMCSEKNPIECHRYFLICNALEQRFSDWLEIRHIVEGADGEIKYISNFQLDMQLKEIVCKRKKIIDIISKDNYLSNYFGENDYDKLKDFCIRYWNLLHGWKRFNNK